MANRPANERVELEMKIMQYRQLMRRMTEEELLKRFAGAADALPARSRSSCRRGIHTRLDSRPAFSLAH
jgi:hypothetical protein